MHRNGGVRALCGGSPVSPTPRSGPQRVSAWSQGPYPVS